MAQTPGTGGAGGPIDIYKGKSPEAKLALARVPPPHAGGSSAGDLLGGVVHALIHGTQSPSDRKAEAAFRSAHGLQGGTVFNPISLGIDTLVHAPQQVASLRQQGAKISSGKASETDILKFGLGGGFGVPFMGVKEPGRPHPLLAAKPTIQKGPAPTAKTLNESVIGSLKGAKGVRAQERTLRSEEVAKRAQAYAKELQQNPTAAGHQAAKAQLAGKLPELGFEEFTHFTPEARDAMIGRIADHPTLRELEKTRASDAIVKLTNGKRPTASEERLIREVFGPDLTKQMMRSVSFWRKARQLGLDIANVPRSVEASADASGLMRQNLMVLTSHPIIWAQNVPLYFKAMRSEEAYRAARDAQFSRYENSDIPFDQMGVDLTEMSPIGRTAIREEPFASPLAEKIPLVRASGRGFTVNANQNRLDVAESVYRIAQANEGKLLTRVRSRGGLAPKLVKEPIDPNDPELLASIGTFVNSATGRGKFSHKKLTDASDAINLIFFSPKLIKSRLDFLNPAYYQRLHPVARHQAYRAIAGLAGLILTADSIASAAGAGVNLDPRSSDFAKIKIGNTRVDLAGGFLQYLRLLAETATMQTTSVSGKTTGLAPARAKAGIGSTSWGAVFLRFLRNKLAPPAATFTDFSLGQNSVGQPVGWRTELVPRFTPLSGQDAVGVGQDTGSVPAGLAAFLASATGVGVQNYKPKAPKTRSGGVDIYKGGTGRSSGSIDIFKK